MKIMLVYIGGFVFLPCEDISINKKQIGKKNFPWKKKIEN